MTFLLRFLLLPLCLTFLAAGASRAVEWAVVIVNSELSATYEEAAAALVSELERNGVARSEVLQVTAAGLGVSGTLSPKLFVALGTEAASALARRELQAPVLCALLPRISFDRVLRESDRRPSPQFSALYLDQPLTRQLDLVRLALPQVRRIGALFGPESKTQSVTLEERTRARGLKLISAEVQAHEPVFQGLKKILDEADLLLALPDPQIYNSSSIQNILLASYRARVPMLAFSPAYVRAGALLAVYSTPAQISSQTAVMARGALQGKALPLPQYPQDFTVGVNEHVARSLGLTLDATTLTDRLRRMESGP